PGSSGTGGYDAFNDLSPGPLAAAIAASALKQGAGGMNAAGGTNLRDLTVLMSLGRGDMPVPGLGNAMDGNIGNNMLLPATSILSTPGAPGGAGGASSSTAVQQPSGRDPTSQRMAPTSSGNSIQAQNSLTAGLVPMTDRQSTGDQDLKFPLIDTITPAELWRRLVGRDPDILVIDVRGRDHEGGHIPDSIHVKTNEVIANTGFLMAEVRSRKVRSVVFTCMYSVLRARRCCSALAEYQRL
ncbi:unnamed protein product, partial [Amoebophrya sp. A25]